MAKMSGLDEISNRLLAGKQSLSEFTKVGKKLWRQMSEQVAAVNSPLLAGRSKTMMGLPPHMRAALPTRIGFSADLMMGDIQPKLEQTAPELEPEYYEENFDPVKAMLMQIPSEGVDIEYFQTQVGRLMLQLDKITESLSKQVMSHHDEMVAGMSLVTELERDLQLTHIICKNGRRYLDAAMREVSQDLVVTANVKRKQILLDMLPILMRMQSVSEIKSQLESTVQQGNYAKALRMCSECLLLMEDNPELKAFGDLTQGIEEWLQRTVEKVDEVLRDNCRKFDTKSYAMVIDGYAVMGDAMGLADKVQSFFAQSIVLMTHDVLKSFAVQTIESNKDPQAVAKKVRLPYNDLCLQLPEMLFRQCLHKMLEVIFDLLCSYYTMMVFEHPEPVPENKFLSTVEESGGGGSRHRRALSIGGTGNTSPSRDQLASTAGGLSPSSSFENFRSAAGRPSSPLRRPLSPVNDKLSGVGSTSGRGRQGKAADGGSPRRGSSYDLIGAERGGFLVMRSDEDSNLAGRALDWSDAGLFGDRESVARVRKETTSTVRKALEKGRKTVWELAARRVSSLLASDAICSASPHHFLQSLELTNKFILAGEAFSGAEAVQLRARLAKQSERYFRTFHRQNLEVLRMMLDKELWQGLPSSALKTVNLAALTGNGVSASSPSSMGQADRSSGELAASNNADQAQRDGALSTSRHREDASRAAALDGGEATTSGRGSFADWVAGGNPFVDKRASAPSPSPSSPVGADGGKSSSAGSPTGQPGSAGEETETSGSPREISIGQANGNVASSNGQDASRLTSMNGEGDEEEEENEELMADFIDEESQKPKLRRMSRGRGGEQRGNFSEGERGPMLTASAISVLRYMDKYARLMQILQPIAEEVFKGLSQLFEVYLFTVFKVFGQKELLFPQNRLNDASTSGTMTPQLRAALLRINQSLEDLKSKTNALGASATLAAAAAAVVATPSSSPNETIERALASGASVAIISPANLYGLKERSVATESLVWLAEMMKRSRPRFQSMVPPTAKAGMEHFYSRTVAAVPDMRAHVYRMLARLLLNVQPFVERIANVRWELKDLGMEHNAYVDQILAEYKQYVFKLTNTPLARDVQDTLFRYGVDVIAEVIVEGISRVKRCNNEGRALMSLDLQVLINGLTSATPTRTKPDLSIVDNYVKAFYMTDSQFLPWVRSHPEFNKTQVISLINLVASMNNWKRKTRVDLVERIESGDL